MNPVHVLEQFLQKKCTSDRPLLIGLSGGADSLCLLYSLVEYKKKCHIDFYVAHIDHGWRQESAQEAIELEKLAQSLNIPFYMKRLNPADYKGNLEEICRKERYSFFNDLCEKHSFQGVLLGHHGDDLAETVLKRVLEGSHWSHVAGLKEDSIVYGVRVLRPFLSLQKSVILDWLKTNGKVHFEDRTNDDSRYMRARMRKEIIPQLNLDFGKNIYPSLIQMSKDSEELASYFDEKIQVYLKEVKTGPFGSYLDLKDTLSTQSLEIKYLVRKLCEINNFYLSRDNIELAVRFLQEGASNKLLKTGLNEVWIDRKCIFITKELPEGFEGTIPIAPGKFECGNWIIEVKSVKDVEVKMTCWKEVWEGRFSVILPKGNFHLAPPVSNASYQGKSGNISEWWSTHKIPAFFRNKIPVIWEKDTIYHEFLTSRPNIGNSNKAELLEMMLIYKK
ncbi:MAG: tRNA lysidine(34) synthetase TilS [Parachlamydiaceae bacterium]|nr:tRNA lysidine(34) synthetase TilS [Parachlamydiaceae bacterium]